jgi:hemolysin III
MQDGERFNSLSHLAGSVAALAGGALLVVMASQQGDLWKVVSFAIYGTTLFLLYLISTLYHGSSGPAKRRLRHFDHYSIYLLIAGTYTPFTLVTLNAAGGWKLFATIWGLALLGMALDTLPQPGGRRILPVLVYLLMGWLVLLLLEPLLAVLPQQGFAWLLAGGLCYTGGLLFFVLGRYRRGAHGIWHLFVLAGSACHYWAIFAYVL